MAGQEWCGCESTSAHYTIGGLRSDLRRTCRVAEGLESVAKQNKTLEDEESVTESDSDWVGPSKPLEDDDNKKEISDSEENVIISKQITEISQNAVAESHAGVNVRKRKRDESTLDTTCKKHKKSDTISICIKVSNLVVNISVQGNVIQQ